MGSVWGWLAAALLAAGLLSAPAAGAAPERPDAASGAVLTLEPAQRPPINIEGRTLAATAKECCKHCSKGKPCGNSCIAKSKTCHQPPGCAC
jgi:hypothetical protein